jgi:hypothetical protein
MSTTHRTQDIHKRTLTVRSYIGRTLIFIILFIIVWQVYLLLNPHARIRFTTYKPAGESITDVQEVMYSSPIIGGINNFVTPKVSVRYTLSSTRLDVFQEKSAQAEPDCADYSGQTCEVRTTPAGQKYVLAAAQDGGPKDAQGQPKVDQAVEFFKGNTRIYISPRGPFSQGTDKWDKLIDSFQSAKISPLPASWEQPGL